MFFRNKDQEMLLKKLDQKLKTLDHKLDLLDHKTSDEKDSLAQISQNLVQLHSSVQKHDMAIEDLLDTWEEKQSDENDVREQFRKFDQTEKHLLALFDAYQEQFWNLKRFADTKDKTWSEQISLMEKNLEHYRKLCGISIIGECGVPVDYDLHEVIQAVDSTDKNQDKLIAEIYRCGYLYKGTVIKKAQVCAYRAVPK